MSDPRHAMSHPGDRRCPEGMTDHTGKTNVVVIGGGYAGTLAANHLQMRGDINVTMIISVPRGKTRDGDRQALLDDLRDIAPVAPDAADRARARLVFSEADGVEHSRLIELTEHHITAKRRVSAVDDQGNSIRILSAVDAILDVAAEHEGELRAAVEAGLV